MEQDEEKELIEENVSASSSPPTPPSPLPVSVGPGNQKYSFSPSLTPSPPFSPPLSSNTSADNLPLQLETLSTPAKRPLAFSLDRKVPDVETEGETSCLKDLLYVACFCQIDILGKFRIYFFLLYSLIRQILYTSISFDWVDWFVLRLCCCLSWSSQIFDQGQKQD